MKTRWWSDTSVSGLVRGDLRRQSCRFRRRVVRAWQALALLVLSLALTLAIGPELENRALTTSHASRASHAGSPEAASSAGVSSQLGRSPPYYLYPIIFVGNNVVDMKWDKWEGGFHYYAIMRHDSEIKRYYDRETTFFTVKTPG